MLHDLMDKLNNSALLNKATIFVLGALLGSALTVVIVRLPFDLVSFQEAEDKPFAAPKEEFKLPPMDLPTNARIEKSLKYYQHPGRTRDLLESYQRGGKYAPMISAIFEEYNLPQALVYLPILESRFLPASRSRAGAVGLWQIMPATASEHGLKYNRWIDERRDPEKSTLVAAEYLQYLYAKFGNWDLTLAAWNCGFTKLGRALRRDETSDFWRLQHIPRETYNFVPNYYAILHLLTEPEKYGLTLPEQSQPFEYETLDLEATFSVKQIARLANVSPQVIKKFNPALLSNIAPSGTYSIRVPVGVKSHFLAQYKQNPLDRVEITYTSYKVRRGDTLLRIANRFGTTVRAIMADNNLRSARWIKAGKRLRIASVKINKALEADTNFEGLALRDSTEDANKVRFVYRVDREGLALTTLARYYSVSADDLKTWNPWLDRDKLQTGEELNIFKPIADIGVHKTRRGDSLWKLARRYHTTVGNLKRWNQLQGSRIYPGSNLIVGLN